MHVTKCACFEHNNREVTTGHTQSSLTSCLVHPMMSLYLILYYSLVFTSLLPFQTLTCYPHTAAVIGLTEHTHSKQVLQKNYISSVRKHSILP